jgi:hypothetical protein
MSIVLWVDNSIQFRIKQAFLGLALFQVSDFNSCANEIWVDSIRLGKYCRLFKE